MLAVKWGFSAVCCVKGSGFLYTSYRKRAENLADILTRNCCVGSAYITV